ncbi:formylglycine-generating enzyme required for sulfatase activity [Duganella sp. 1224]|uniref:formylglycine-generating enzyme family protein n=1 Tax=Duganella sp. 1224 TaxID=2587052 RepID=UPI00180CB1F7|nr:SUMF1/EgtB/PvdO family nonheme iron enzyme [Duganella sp. 1224]NYE60712.1 formylglycine-generating enzyme required for sulfatase activity [Duganella sp. 1224]
MKLPRLKVLLAMMLAAALAPSARAQDTRYVPHGSYTQLAIPAPACAAMNQPWEGPWQPCTGADHQEWLQDLRRWRDERRIRVGYDGSRYARPAAAWTQSSFMQAQMMVEDRYVYDPATRQYTVDRYLDDLIQRFGGIDAVLVWPTYPNIGLDDRNTIDLVRALPGGIPGVKKMVADFHRRGVRVLFPMMLWDQGTRAIERSWPDELAALMKEIGADGINGDTQDGVPLAFTLAADQAGHPLVFQPEGLPSDEALAWNLMTWGQYTFPFAPTVDRYKWLEPRHMVNISDRWNRGKTDDLQFAFFNGVGWESWENIWGIWNGITPRDGEATRRVATLERLYARFLVSPEWEPHYPARQYGVYTSRWPLAEGTLWTIVNRNEYDSDGVQLRVPYQPGARYFDAWHGVELTPARDGDGVLLSFPIEARGYGAVLMTQGAPEQRALDTMRALTARPLRDWSAEWAALPQTVTPVAATAPAASAPPGMVEIPAGRFDFSVRGLAIEGGNSVGVDVQYPWEQGARRFHQRSMDMRRFYIDRYPVTNAQFKAFLDATHYHPADDANFLKHWRHGSYPDGWGNKPVTWVSLEDARAYAAWAGKRLPREWEWQYAASGGDGRVYPWGDAWRADAVPRQASGRLVAPPDDVDAHPAGASPFGVQDLVGNVWQWTDEYSDAHTRFAILRGGSSYRPQGSIWYFPAAYRNDQHGKLLLMAPGRDRAATLGFRCVTDAG